MDIAFASVGVFLSIFSAMGHATFQPDWDCEVVFDTAPVTLLLHKEWIANETLTRVGAFRDRIRALLKTSDETFSLDRPEFAGFEEFTGDAFFFNRSDLQSLDQGLELLRALIQFQSDFVSAYETWIGKIRLQDTGETIGGKGPYEWKRTGARKAFFAIEDDFAARRNVPWMPCSAPHFKHDDPQAHHAHIPEFFQSWLRDHASMMDFYGLPRARVYYDLVADLDLAYAHGLLH